MSSKTRAIFPARLDSLQAISQFFSRAAESAGFDERAVYHVQLAVEEACANIVQHAYAGEEQAEIDCTAIVRAGCLTMVLRDQGRPFDPDRIPGPDLESDLEQRQLGGLGLYFMRQLMDQVDFEFDADSGNLLTMTKCIDTKNTKESKERKKG